jgi:AAA+ superfamily predicted ATPase
MVSDFLSTAHRTDARCALDNVLLVLVRYELDRETMELDPKLVASLRNAADATDDVELRLHLATLLIEAGRRDEGIREVGIILQAQPTHAGALALVARAAAIGDPPALTDAPGRPGRTPHDDAPSEPQPSSQAEAELTAEAQPPAEAQSSSQPQSPPRPQPSSQAEAELTAEAQSPSEAQPASRAGAESITEPIGEAAARLPDFDWSAAESQLADVLPPRFVGPDGAAERGEAPAGGESAEPGAASAFDVEHAGLRLADVAGMTEVKQRLEAAFLAPMRNPELRKLYGKSLRGGLLMYGPPGCGKTFIARAVAGELGARFLAVSFADVIDGMLGQSERNIHEIFGVARQNAPCVVFLDEVDAIGQKRTQLRHTPMRAVVNQLLHELDDVTGSNEGVFLLAATNHPWDVDSALRRPGRFDRMLLVLPPDQAARAAIFRYHLRDRPVERVDPERLARLTDGYSGADIAHVCESAAELALLDSVRRGEPRMIGQPDLEAAIGEVSPSLSPWFDAARNVALFANEGGAYDDLAAYLKKNRML